MLKESVWARLTPSELWGRIRTEAADYYHHSLDRCVCVLLCMCVSVVVYVQHDFTSIFSVSSESMDDIIEKHGLQRISLLREMAIKTGIQVRHLSLFSTKYNMNSVNFKDILGNAFCRNHTFCLIKNLICNFNR